MPKRTFRIREGEPFSIWSRMAAEGRARRAAVYAGAGRADSADRSASAGGGREGAASGQQRPQGRG